MPNMNNVAWRYVTDSCKATDPIENQYRSNTITNIIIAISKFSHEIDCPSRSKALSRRSAIFVWMSIHIQDPPIKRFVGCMVLGSRV